MIRSPVAIGKLASWPFFSALLLVLCAGVAWACKTPVYRYSLYNWKPSVYRVYYVHSGDGMPAADAQTNAALTKIAAEKPPANLEFHAVRTDDPESLDELAAEVRNEATAIIADLPAEKLPAYVIVDPNRNELHSGPLTAADVAALVDSPVRGEVNRRIEQGHAAVLIVVGGADAQSNAKAQQQVDAIVEAVAQGKIKPPKLPGDEQSTDEGAVDDTEPANPPPLAVSSVKLDRKDEKERWLLKCLLQVEEDLADIDEPMVFAVYGQCRANPPLVGDGINAEELTKQVQFVLGPCTCTIKEQNLGLDLLARFDWHSVALALAKRIGPETGNEHLLGADAFPNLFPKLHEPAVEKPKVDEPAPAANRPGDTGPAAVSGQAAASHSTESAGVDELAWSYRVLGLAIVAGIIVLAVVTMRVLRSPGV